MKILQNKDLTNIIEQLDNIGKYLDECLNYKSSWFYSNLTDDINKIRYTLEQVAIQETCSSCSKKLLCKQADKMKLETGYKLNEMWFNCWEENTK